VRNIITSTLKCVAIGSTFFLLFKFSRGRQHYLEYMKSLFTGAGFGVAYSIYFTDQKLMYFLSNQTAIEEYIQEKKRMAERLKV